ncbi:cytochrome P450, partial [Thozetella sp. PMI_491]
FRTNFPKIAGIPEVASPLPFVGHLHLIGGPASQNDATVYTSWGKQLDSDLIQARFGNQRTVIVTKFHSIKKLWVDRAKDLIDRPPQPGFLDKLGIDLSGSALTPVVKKCRVASVRALSKQNWPKYYHLLEPSSASLISSVYSKGENGLQPMDLYPYLRHVVFDLCLSLTYGARFGEVDDGFMLNFIHAINEISAVRSSTKRFRTYVPLLRIIPEQTSTVIAAEKIRAKHVDILYGKYKERVAAGETVDCIVSSLNEDKLTEEEVHGTCISLLQAAPDSVASSVYLVVAWLSTPQGRATQQDAYEAILDAYGGDRDLAWASAFREEKVALVSSLYKEGMRFFTVAPYATPRTTVAEIKYGSVTLPKGLTLVMNAQEANHDLDHYGPDAWEFNPRRFVGSTDALPHLAFGAGSRICPAVNISNRIVYAMLTRLLLSFEFTEPEGPDARKSNVDPIHFSAAYDELVAHPRKFDSHFTSRDPEWLKSMVERDL